jgi:hypothetical protein
MDLYQIVADRLTEFDRMHKDLQQVILLAMDSDEDMERKLRRIFEAFEDSSRSHSN